MANDPEVEAQLAEERSQCEALARWLYFVQSPESTEFHYQNMLMADDGLCVENLFRIARALLESGALTMPTVKHISLGTNTCKVDYNEFAAQKAAVCGLIGGGNAD